MTLVKVGNLPPIENISDEDMLMIQDREFGKTCRISVGELIKSPLFQNNLIADLVAGSNVSISQQTTPNLEDGSWEEAEEPIDLTVIPEFDPTQKYEIGQVVYTVNGTTTKFWRLLKRIITISSVGGSGGGGGLTPEQEAKLNSVSMGATKTEPSSIKGNIKINGSETEVLKVNTALLKSMPGYTNSLGDTTFTDLVLLVRALVDQLG